MLQSEINLDLNYVNYINRIIDYKIIRFTNSNYLLAFNIKREFCSEYKDFINNKSFIGKVIDKRSNGFLLEITSKFVGFLPNSFVKKRGLILEKND